MKRHASTLALLALFVAPFAVWASGTANNPQSQISALGQGPDPTGNNGYPMSVVNATGTSLDVNVASGIPSPLPVSQDAGSNPWTVNGTVTSNQGAPNAGSALSWPFNIQGQDSGGAWNSAGVSSNSRVDAAGQLGLQTISYLYSRSLSDGKRRPVDFLDPWPVTGTQFNPQGGNALFCGSQLLAETDESHSVPLRTPAVFKPQNAVAIAAEATIWTPAGGKKFRLMGYHLTSSVTGNILLRDNTAGTIIDVIPATAGQCVVVDLHNGILSAAANNVLTATGPALSTLSGEVDGTEE